MIKNLLIKLIKLYQISPLGCHNNCKYIPTCSNYAIDAIGEYGVFKGSILSIGRILRCNPFSKGGIDYVRSKDGKEIKRI